VLQKNGEGSMIDNHVHIGWYSDGYHFPKDVWNAELKAGMNEIVVSSTSTCAEQYKLVVKEMLQLIRLAGDCIHPILWITPKMIKTWGMRYMLNSKIRWQGIKMHWGAHREWYYNAKLTRKALDIAMKMNVPVIFHTGCNKECDPSVFMSFCDLYPNLTFVLAHGRPIEKALIVLEKCANTYVDTAFMPIEDILLLVEKGFEKRILFGTDVPINLLYYESMSIEGYIEMRLKEMTEMLSPHILFEIMNKTVFFNR